MMPSAQVSSDIFDISRTQTAAIHGYAQAVDAFLKILENNSAAQGLGNGQYNLIKAQADAMHKRGKELKEREIELQNKTAMEKKKRPVVQEFVDSEARYNNNLRDLIKHYLTPRE
jgi:hypothetical protein